MSPAIHQARYRLLWRVHFYAALFTAPIVIWAAVTGIIYAFHPQIEAWRYAHLDQVTAQNQKRPLQDQVAAALQRMPTQRIRMVIPGHAPTESTQVYLTEATAREASSHAHTEPMRHIVYVDPYTAQVLGQHEENARFKNWSRDLHSQMLQGEGWRWIIELGATWLLVMLLTGLYLWWQQSQQQKTTLWAALWPHARRGSRPWWRQIHSLVGVVFSLVLATILVTGLTWSRYSGEVFRITRDALGHLPPRPPPGMKVNLAADATRLSWQAVDDIATRHAPDIQRQIVPPRTPQDVWRIDNYDRSQLQKRFSLAIHPGTGDVLYQSGWQDFPGLVKATAIGIPFHRGEFGWWNQGLVAGAGFAVLFSLVSGWIMWWQRRPPQLQGIHLAPAALPGSLSALPRLLWPLLALAAVAMPLFGVSLLGIGLIEGVVYGFKRLHHTG